MTVQKNRKTLTTVALALAVVASLSVSAFAQNPNGTLALKMTKSVPATAITDTAKFSADEDAALGILTRENAKTGKLEVSSDGGKTWTEFDGLLRYRNKPSYAEEIVIPNFLKSKGIRQAALKNSE